MEPELLILYGPHSTELRYMHLPLHEICGSQNGAAEDSAAGI